MSSPLRPHACENGAQAPWAVPEEQWASVSVGVKATEVEVLGQGATRDTVVCDLPQPTPPPILETSQGGHFHPGTRGQMAISPGYPKQLGARAQRGWPLWFL